MSMSAREVRTTAGRESIKSSVETRLAPHPFHQSLLSLGYPKFAESQTHFRRPTRSSRSPHTHLHIHFLPLLYR